MSKLVIDDLPDVENRFVLGECIGSGVCGKVYSAVDSGSGGKKVAIKMQKINRETMPYIQEEYRVLQEFSSHPNLVDFYGVYRKVGENDDEVWFILELCDGGTVSDLVGALLNNNRRMTEEHIAYILKEIIKALVHLHENRVMHRDVKASNILFTKEGDVKLVDFGLSRHLSSTFGKSDSCIGSPCWMAPEVVMSSVHEDEESGYGNRADVWALGITAIELGDGKAPFQDMHPTRAMFQIVRNPPPTLYRPSNWTETFNDFINECLVKNPEHRPYVMEMIEHPFLAEVPENNYHLTQELKMVIQDMAKSGKQGPGGFEALVNRNFLKRSRDEQMEKMYVEDLAALDRISEDSILQELQMRMKQGHFQTFIGDVLLILNPNEKQDIYGPEYHEKYIFKSRSDNAPHIFAIADSAYQDALHHIIPQNIVLAGESGSGKTTNYLHLVDHLLHVSFNPNINSSRIKDAVKLIHAFTHSSTPLNDYSTRCVLKTEMTFGSTGKVSGAIFNMYQLEKWRVSTIDMTQSNYHILYYLYDGLAASGLLERYKLSPGRKYRYLRISDETTSKSRPRDNPQRNAKKFEKLLEVFKTFEFGEDQLTTVLNVLAAVLVIGDVRFKESAQGVAEVENEGVVSVVAELLEIDDKKLVWALTNYCLIKKGAAVRRRHSCDESRDARDVLANMLYCRLVDYVVNVINNKLSYGRAIFGDKYSIRILDMFGFECFKENHLQQLFANTFNEQLHYHYLQRVFAWEALEMNEEDVPYTPIHYYDNKTTLDQILSKPEGVLPLIDDASRMGHGGEYIIDYLKNPERDHLKVLNGKEFSISHYTGKITYNVKEMADRNRDFLPPEVIETIRLSKNKIVKSFFANKLTRTGNLYTSFDEDAMKSKNKYKFGSSSSDEDILNKTSDQQFSQIKKMRTAVSTFRSLCLELLKELSVGGGSGGTHFVRCIRSDLEGQPKGFHVEIVKQQLRSMSVVDTATARQRGYPHRVSFSEFLRRYKFLAFDFDENVEVSKENCRLLLIRLKMEGWVIGKSKVFLKYYNEEYLSRLYETQVKKIIKVQSMMRGFLTKIKLRRQAAGGKVKPKSSAAVSQEDIEEDKAARVLQKAYRGVASRKVCGPIIKDQFEKLDADTCKFISIYCTKWRAKSIFQVLLQYRAARYQDLFNFSQQVHLYNQIAVFGLQQSNNSIGLDLVNRHAQPNAWLGEAKPTVLKLPFRLDEIPFFDTSYMCDPLTNPGASMQLEEDWDSPFQWRNTVSSQITASLQKEEKLEISKPYSAHISVHTPLVDPLINLPYNRDPSEPVRRLSTIPIEPDYMPNSRMYDTKQFQPPPPPISNFNNSSHNPNQVYYGSSSTNNNFYRNEQKSMQDQYNQRFMNDQRSMHDHRPINQETPQNRSENNSYSHQSTHGSSSQRTAHGPPNLDHNQRSEYDGKFSGTKSMQDNISCKRSAHDEHSKRVMHGNNSSKQDCKPMHDNCSMHDNSSYKSVHDNGSYKSAHDNNSYKSMHDNGSNKSAHDNTSYKSMDDNNSYKSMHDNNSYKSMHDNNSYKSKDNSYKPPHDNNSYKSKHDNSSYKSTDITSYKSKPTQAANKIQGEAHDINHYNSKPANKDFDYIKSNTSSRSKTSSSGNPIAELQNLGRRDSTNEDDPPFNFQAMLRKTNVNRESVKKSVDTIRNYSLKRKGTGSSVVYDSRSNSLRRHKSVDYLNKEKLELAPGIYIEGVVADL